ncbi:MAG: hydrolase [Rhodospirillaceae bacterium]|nr:hydrolase [Rhodospirillaceae bacterium]MBL6932395.1 hydrolase [Rhodospirillales bacterium]
MLIKAEKSTLLVVDIQEKLAGVMNGIDQVVGNTSILMKSAQQLSIPQLVSEQYPKGLGATLGRLSELSNSAPIEKLSFSCMDNDDYVSRFNALGREQAVIAGMEAHVCVLQTAMDLLHRDVQVFVVADATTSRSPDSHSMALHRLSGAGAEIVTTEMVVFEWLGRAGTPQFRELSKLIK